MKRESSVIDNSISPVIQHSAIIAEAQEDDEKLVEIEEMESRKAAPVLEEHDEHEEHG